MSYSIRIKSSATRELARIPKQNRLRIVHAIDNLGDHPLSGKPLKGEFRGLRRVRVGADEFAKITILKYDKFKL